MARYSDPRRPTSNGPKLVNAGKIVMKRAGTGSYTHTTRRWDVYTVVQIENGRWVWAKVGKEAGDSYETKAQACAALQEWIYGKNSFDSWVMEYEY